MKLLVWFLFFVAICFADDSIFEPGTEENPKEDLPYNDDVMVKTLYMPENCMDMAVDGDELGVHYTGYLYKNGKKFDSSLDRNRIFPVKLGAGRVIKGWEKGLWGMCVEEKRRLVIPAGQAYGNRGAGNLIHPGATLIFDVELIGIRGKGKYANKFFVCLNKLYKTLFELDLTPWRNLRPSQICHNFLHHSGSCPIYIFRR